LGDRVQTPFAGHALELAVAAVDELEARPGDEIANGAGDKHLARARLPGDARADRHSDAGDLAVGQLALPRVQPGADLEPERADGLDDVTGAPDRSCGPVESREESVSGRVHLDASISGQLP